MILGNRGTLTITDRERRTMRRFKNRKGDADTEFEFGLFWLMVIAWSVFVVVADVKGEFAKLAKPAATTATTQTAPSQLRGR